VSEDAYEFRMNAFVKLAEDMPPWNTSLRIPEPRLRFWNNSARMYTALPLLLGFGGLIETTLFMPHPSARWAVDV
jgi:hypothetical protein